MIVGTLIISILSIMAAMLLVQGNRFMVVYFDVVKMKAEKPTVLYCVAYVLGLC